MLLQARVDFTNLHENYFFFKDNICWQYLAGKIPRVIIVPKTHTTCTCINKPCVRTLEISKADKLVCFRRITFVCHILPKINHGQFPGVIQAFQIVIDINLFANPEDLGNFQG